MSKMVLNDDNFGTLSEFLGITRQALSRKVDGSNDFKQTEIDKLISRWGLTPHEVVQIFFDSESDED